MTQRIPEITNTRYINKKGKRPNVQVMAQDQRATSTAPQTLNKTRSTSDENGNNSKNKGPNRMRKESAKPSLNQAAAESEHWVVRGNAKSTDIVRELVSHACDEYGTLSSSLGKENIFSEHHQDPPTYMEGNLLGVDENKMVVEGTVWEVPENAERVEPEIGRLDSQTGMT